MPNIFFTAGGSGGGGERGPEGPEGKPGLTWRGEWKAATAYAINDAVEWKGSSYRCVKAMSAGEDKEPPNAEFWGVIAKEGKEGKEGPAGGVGPEGPKGEMLWRGAWSGATEYAKGDAVEEGGSTYVSIKAANLNHKPSELGIWWALVAKKGAEGPEGKAPTAKVDIFTVDKEKWKKPAGAQVITVICIGAGGGGGGGAHGKSATICTGGGGGGGGSITFWTFAASELNEEEECRVNAVVAKGGKGFETEKAGENGTAGSNSKFGARIEAAGGAAGKAGEITGVIAKGGAGGLGQNEGNAGGDCAATGKPAATPNGKLPGAVGGGAGGGVTATPTGENGEKGAASLWGQYAQAAGGVGGTTGEAGKDGPETEKNTGIPGGGGGGGGGTSATNGGGKGGKGGGYGSGGGGGGATVTAAKFSGEGGEGGKGVVIVISR